MNPTSTDPLHSFEQRLLRELRRHVEAHAAGELQPDRLSPAIAPRRRLARGLARRRSLGACAIGASAACAAALIAVSAGQAPGLAQALPIFAQPPTGIPASALAAILRDQGADHGAAGIDVHNARAFSTPLGTGYAATDQQADLVCIAAPGLGGTWGATCDSASQAENNGTGGLSIIENGQDALYVELLPTGATVTATTPGGAPRPLSPNNGVLAIVVPQGTVMTTTIAGHTTTETVPTASVG